MSNLVGKTLLNRYNVQEFLGRGAMAEVYKVWDSERAVHLAMKVLHADLAEDKIFLRRFKREANNLAQLQHPHIVRFYGMEQDQFTVFMLMDFVEGKSLKTRIFRKETAFTPEEVRRILKPLTSALHFAHRRGLVHCDIKPANIMLDKYGEVRLADFGIARMSDAATATMVGAGTPAYMAPEQIKGQDPTPQSDIYALGIVLYEMLTGGERPFTGEQATITGSTSEKVRWEQRNISPPSPSQWNTKISPAVEEVILKCLNKDAAQRYKSALDFFNAFEIATKPVAKAPPSPEEADVPFEEAESDESSQDAPNEQDNQPSESGEAGAEPTLGTVENSTSAPQAKIPRPTRRKWFIAMGVVVILSFLVGGVLFFNPGLSPPFTPLSIATETRTPVPTKTRVPPTPTVAPPAVLSDYLENVKVTSVDDFSSSKGWHLSAGKISGGVLELVGKDWNGLSKRGTFSEGTGILINFKYERGAEFVICYDHGAWQTDDYRSFGIQYWGTTAKSHLWLGENDLGTKNLHGNLSGSSETWHTLLLVTEADGEFLAVIWETDNPARAAVYHEKNEKWAGYNWDFRITANKGTITFDDFKEITFSKIKQ